MELPPSAAPLRALPADSLPSTVLSAVRDGSAGTADASAYLYEPAIAAGNAAALRACLPAWAEICYAVKANGFAPILDALLSGLGIDGFEVSSTREVRLALDAFDRVASRRRRLVSSGPAKSLALLTALAETPDAVVNVESPGELHRLEGVAARLGRRVTVAVRVNPRQVRLTGSLQMGGRPSAFGVPEPEVPAVLELARRLPHVDVAGFHVHAVSANLDVPAHLDYVRWCLDFAERAARAARMDLRLLDVGGGFGVPFEPDRKGERPFDLARFGDGLSRLAVPTGVQMIFEPGRLLVADCGWYAAQVADVKRSYGTTFVVLRGGIHHFALPTSWEIVHNFAVVNRNGPLLGDPGDQELATGPNGSGDPGRGEDPGVRDPAGSGTTDQAGQTDQAGPAGPAGPAEEREVAATWPMAEVDTTGRAVTVVGELCTPEDTLARDITVGPVRTGDAVVFPMAGAYGYEFALAEFLGHARPRRVVLPPAGGRLRAPRSLPGAHE
ncbi:diaminopimelate decarboxylase [Frankia sp. AiPs1]|uniref:alanine racemase n=1 Tax=Frankia sp. AiPa1 TaxID=573492 RepID=UPI00202B19A5|nr:alanine racemase [Frankia sp. AiPa1]MCL9759354.1 alanine racemase [Frankia sp. AiPa1]